MSESYSFRSSLNGFNRADVLSFIENLIKEKSELVDKIEKKEAEIENLRKENEDLHSVIAEKSNAENSSEKCSDCDIAKRYEARLGAAMFDAKRFSEILVKEANDKASGLFTEAFSSADATSLKVQKLSHDIIDINNQFNQSFKSLLDNMNSLAKSIEIFKKEAKISGNKFNYTTDFTSEKEASYSSLHFEGGLHINDAVNMNDVNFDDADEYDIRVDV